jgi:uncharacterized protein YceK
MNQSSRAGFLCIIVALTIALEGCGTIRTMPSLATPEQPKIYSGTRLDFHAIRENEERLKKFNAKAPEHPLIDLPFSLILDTIIFPLTYSVAMYELIFN